MHHYSTRTANMVKENGLAAKADSSTRITRARAKAIGSSGGVPPLAPCGKQEQKLVLQPNLKRAASDENKTATSMTAHLKHKKRSVFNDVTNVACKSSYMNFTSATMIQHRKQIKKVTAKSNGIVAADIFVDNPQVEKEIKSKVTEETAQSKADKLEEVNLLVSFNENLTTQTSTKETGVADPVCAKQISNGKSEKIEALDGQAIVIIDSNKDPQMCSMYAADIYNNFCATELHRRPSINYMENVQRDITRAMRAILIDWLVEVSEEHRLVPDTLYLTVNLIDRFLSANYIEKQNLQLLGVTCLLIASKYEEICAPLVEEFCFITDNTYKREEVLEMESQVLSFLGFHLSVPTTKKFLRRFIQAAHASSKVPSVELEFLANYLAELTLTEYSFLKFLPSLIAASAVFLARWTLDQSDHPWNQTLEHYTSYTVPQLKITVLALEELQLNTNGCSLNAIWEKYKQQKFNGVAGLSSSKPAQSLF